MHTVSKHDIGRNPSQIEDDCNNACRTKNLLDVKKYGIRPLKQYMGTQKNELVKTLINNDALSGYAIVRALNMREQTFYRWFKRVLGKTLTEARGNRWRG